MTVWSLKLVAMASMLLDHLGYRLGWDILHSVGRLAFPIYAFLIGNGFRHTANPKRYLLRLLCLAVVSQLPYTLCIFNTLQLEQWNIFFTLALGLIWIWGLQKTKTIPGKLAWCLVLCTVCWLFNLAAPLDYGIRGVALIVSLFYCCGNTAQQRLALLLSFSALYYLPIWQGILLQQPLPQQWQWMIFAMAALPLLFSYRGELGYRVTTPAKALQISFYLFYPVHLLLLWLLIH